MSSAESGLGVYIHIPFCLKKCDYCDFYSLSTPFLPDEYLKALLEDISSFNFEGRRVETIYLGGGTPSLLEPSRLNKIIARLKEVCELSPSAEITCEVNPATIGFEGLSELRAGGYNRLSVGIQSANDAQLKFLGRSHDFSAARECVQGARAAGFRNISADLIYGLPGQDTADFLSSCKEIARLSPDHVSFYCLKLEPGTPLFERIDECHLPGDDALFEMYNAAAGFFEGLGFEHYEISNLARPGFESRHNLRYWTQKDYIGFGPGAHCLVNSTRFFIPCDLEAYILGKLRPSPPERLDFSERVAEFLMLRPRLSRGINPAEFEALFNLSFEPYANYLSSLPENLVLFEGGRYRLTRQGFFVSNSIILNLLNIQEEEECAPS